MGAAGGGADTLEEERREGWVYKSPPRPVSAPLGPLLIFSTLVDSVNLAVHYIYPVHHNH